MTTRHLFTASALVLGGAGAALTFATHDLLRAFGADPEAHLVVLAQAAGALYLGFAVLNWMARNAESSPTRDAVLLGNAVGFGVVAANDVWGVFSGEAREAAKVFLVVHLLFAFAFIVACLPSRRARR